LCFSAKIFLLYILKKGGGGIYLMSITDSVRSTLTGSVVLFNTLNTTLTFSYDPGGTEYFVPQFTQFTRSFSTTACLTRDQSLDQDNLAINPIRSYPNADTDKLAILNDNKNKIGVYR